MGEIRLKSMKNQFLSFTVLYENQNMSAGKEKTQLLMSKVCDF